MSIDHTRIMLNTLKQYSACEISLTSNDKTNTFPMLNICYKDFNFEVTNLRTLAVFTMGSVDSTLSRIETEFNMVY